MRIGFDLDGVVLDIDLGIIRLIDFSKAEDKRVLERFYYASRKIQLNPIDFLHGDDELYFVTGRHEGVMDITESWAKRFFPQATLISVNHGHVVGKAPGDVDRWLYEQAALKAEVIKQCNINVYFEDTPETVKYLRELCPHCTIIQYGGRTGL